MDHTGEIRRSCGFRPRVIALSGSPYGSTTAGDQTGRSPAAASACGPQNQAERTTGFASCNTGQDLRKIEYRAINPAAGR
jgi:hypothetical protein